eukprot:m.14108 g.14108  ORF g.14108 m.14108 type:complete len:808 (+) comp4255_c0_seq1:75-2498(+)
MDGLMRVDGVISPMNGLAFAIDIGGSLAKVAYFTLKSGRTLSVCGDDSIDRSESNEEAASDDAELGRLHLGYFETAHIGKCIKFMKERMGDHNSSCMVRATGGGAHKYTDLFAEEKLVFHKLGEMECLVRGCNYVLEHVEDEAFTFDITNTPQRLFHTKPRTFPYLLVNIGSGVSIIKVNSNTSYERVDGSAVGGGTFLGLASLLTHVKRFGDILSMADEGACGNVDMLVKDIYGESTPPSLGLNPDITASCFGKARKAASAKEVIMEQEAAKTISTSPIPSNTPTIDSDNENGTDSMEHDITFDHKENPSSSSTTFKQHSNSTGSKSFFKDNDVLASLVQMICFNIAQIACLNARLHNTDTIYFAGFFIRNHARIMHIITQAVTYWGQERISALFLRHEGYLGAIGSFLGGLDELDRTSPIPQLHALNEQYVSHASNDLLQDSFKFELVQDSCTSFPLLIGKYHADTIDLMTDTPARDYWLECFKNNIDREWKRALAVVKSDHEDEKTIKHRANAFRSTFLKHMEILSADPSAYGELSVRNILELRQQCLREFGFIDIYENVKWKENELAMTEYKNLVYELDGLNHEEEIRLSIYGVLAGNCFDWGAAEVAKKMEEGVIDFHDQRKKIPQYQWLRNNLEEFVSNCMEKKYKKVVVFADNSGADVILGIVPFARTFIKGGSNVIIAANSFPVLNDITYVELKGLVEKLAAIDQIIATALTNGTLTILPNGSGSPCINLKRVSLVLAQKSQNADLVVLEGMGRAIHTNFEGVFGCDSLKVAMIKNKWLAEKLGGSTYDVVCRLDTAEN